MRRVLTRFCGMNFPSHGAPRPHGRGPTPASNHRWITHLNPSMRPWTPPKGLHEPSWPVLLTQMVLQARLPWRRPPAAHSASLYHCGGAKPRDMVNGAGVLFYKATEGTKLPGLGLLQSPEYCASVKNSTVVHHIEVETEKTVLNSGSHMSSVRVSA